MTASFSLIGHMAAHAVAIFVGGRNIGAIDKEIMNEELKEALELLVELSDLQNGPPTESKRDEWEDVMNRVYYLLYRYGL